MKTIQFIQVGRNKLSWRAQVEEIDGATIARAVKKSGALLSEDIFCEDGKIYAGFRLVGTYTVHDEEIALSQ